MNIKIKYSLIDKKVNDWLTNMRDRDAHGFCIDRYKADFIVEDLFKYKVNDMLNICNNTLKIVMFGKNCYSDCPYFKKNMKPCKLKNGVAFAM